MRAAKIGEGPLMIGGKCVQCGGAEMLTQKATLFSVGTERPSAERKINHRNLI